MCRIDVTRCLLSIDTCVYRSLVVMQICHTVVSVQMRLRRHTSLMLLIRQDTSCVSQETSLCSCKWDWVQKMMTMMSCTIPVVKRSASRTQCKLTNIHCSDVDAFLVTCPVCALAHSVLLDVVKRPSFSYVNTNDKLDFLMCKFSVSYFDCSFIMFKCTVHQTSDWLWRSSPKWVQH